MRLSGFCSLLSYFVCFVLSCFVCFVLSCFVLSCFVLSCFVCFVFCFVFLVFLSDFLNYYLMFSLSSFIDCMRKKIIISSGSLKVYAELFSDKSPETFKEIVSALPFSSVASTWGDEIYFEIPVNPVNSQEENLTSSLEVGDIAFWPQGNCFCIFFGKTPASSSDKPAPASPVNLVGTILEIDSLKINSLKKVSNNDKITVEVIE